MITTTVHGGVGLVVLSLAQDPTVLFLVAAVVILLGATSTMFIKGAR